MDMLYKYKDTFSISNDIGICQNIEVQKDITNKSPYFIRPYHVKEGDKDILDKEMKRLCFRYIKGRFSAHSRPVMLISRKVTKDKF